MARGTQIPLLPGESGRPIAFERILQEAGEVRNSLHRHDYSEIFIFLSGSGTHMIDLRQHTVAAPCAHVVRAGQVHHLVRSGDMEGFVFEFKQDALKEPRRLADAEMLFRCAAHEPSLPLDASRRAVLSDVARMLEAELAEPGGGQQQILESLLGIALAKCVRWWSELLPEEGVAEAVDTDLMDRFRALVDKHFLELRQVKEYAEKLHVTPGHLSDVVRARLGTTPGALIDDRLLLEAKRLLLHSALTVKESGYSIGMKDPAYFARWFKKLEGQGPAEYRTRVREQYS